MMIVIWLQEVERQGECIDGRRDEEGNARVNGALEHRYTIQRRVRRARMRRVNIVER
jgi:hypothetical protein